MAESDITRSSGIILGPAVPLKTLPDILESPFPEKRVIHWIPPDRATTEAFSIVVASEVLLQTSRHVAQSVDRELGGFLLGNRYRCRTTGREYIVIDQYVAAEYTEGTAVSLTFTHEAFAHLDGKLTGKYFGKKLVGWYHSHPGMSIFLSNHDLIVHQERFADPWMVALVLEPVSHLGGFFAWDAGRIDPNRYCNFYELLEGGGGRESVVAWGNYEGLDPLDGEQPLLAAVNTATADASFESTRPLNVSADGYYLPNWWRGNAKWYGAILLALIALVVVYWATRPPTSILVPDPTNVNSAGQPLVSVPSASPQQTQQELTRESQLLKDQLDREEQQRIKEEQETRQRRALLAAQLQKDINQLARDQAKVTELQGKKNDQVKLMNDIEAEMSQLVLDSPEYMEKKKTFDTARRQLNQTDGSLTTLSKRITATQKRISRAQ